MMMTFFSSQCWDCLLFSWSSAQCWRSFLLLVVFFSSCWHKWRTFSLSKTGQNPLGQHNEAAATSTLSSAAVEKQWRRKALKQLMEATCAQVGGCALSLSLETDQIHIFFLFNIFAREEKTKLFFSFCYRATATTTHNSGGFIWLEILIIWEIESEKKEVIFGGKTNQKKSGQCQTVQFLFFKSFIRRPPSVISTSSFSHEK